MSTLVLTPQVEGADGVSALSRQILLALRAARAPAPIELWALEGAVRDAAADAAWSAAGSRARFVARGLAAAAGCRVPAAVISLHLQLSPVALPLMARGVPLIQWLLGIEAWRPLTWPQHAAVTRATRLVGISRYTLARFAAASPDLARHASTVCHPALAPGHAGALVPREPIVLIVGRMAADERYKGHDALIDAWPQVRAARPDARLWIVGEGDDRPRLEARAAQAGVGDAVRFTGAVDEAAVREAYARASVFAMPSPQEGFGLVYLEALHAGTPCVVAPGAAEEIVDDGRTGAVVPTGDAGALAAAILRFLGPEGRAMETACRETVRTRFAFDRLVRDVRHLVEETRCASLA